MSDATVSFIVLDIRLFGSGPMVSDSYVYDGTLEPRYVDIPTIRFYGRTAQGESVVCESLIADDDLRLAFFIPSEGVSRQEAEKTILEALLVDVDARRKVQIKSLIKFKYDRRRAFYGFVPSASGEVEEKVVAILSLGAGAGSLRLHSSFARAAESTLQDRPFDNGIRFAGYHGKGTLISEVLSSTDMFR